MSHVSVLPERIRLTMMSRLYTLTIPVRVGGISASEWRRQLVEAGPVEPQILACVERLEAQEGVWVMWTHEDQVCIHHEMTSHVREQFERWKEARRKRLARSLRRYPRRAA